MKIPTLLIFILLFANLLPAQEKDTTYKYWMTVGIWIERNGALNFNYSFSLGDNFYKVNYLKKGDTIFGGFGSNDFLFNSFDLSVGKRFQSKWFQAGFFAGPSYIYGEKYINTNRNEKFKTAGLQIDTQLLFRLANEVGIGIGLFANLNLVKNFTGFNINFAIGNGK